MEMTLRWFGADDPIPLKHIRQIPGVTGIVSSVCEIAAGDSWTASSVDRVAEYIDNAGLQWSVIESIPVHEHIKLGLPTRGRFIDAWCASLRQVARVGGAVVCYNFMPVFDWTRTNLAMLNADGSTAPAYDDRLLQRVDLSRGTGELPGWGAVCAADELNALLAEWRNVDGEKLWEDLEYFLARMVPVAASLNVKLAIHPDDFTVARIRFAAHHRKRQRVASFVVAG